MVDGCRHIRLPPAGRQSGRTIQRRAPSRQSRGRRNRRGRSRLMGKTETGIDVRRIAEMDGLVLAYPACERGIGAVITNPSSADLIAGVKAETIALWPDD